MGWGRPAPGGGQQTRWGGSHLSSPAPRLGRPSSSAESLLRWGRAPPFRKSPAGFRGGAGWAGRTGSAGAHGLLCVPCRI